MQLTTCFLNSSWRNFILLACLPYAKAVANVMANKPQSTVFSNLLLTAGKYLSYSFGIPLEKVIGSSFCLSPEVYRESKTST